MGGPAVEASAAVRGIVGLGAQTFGGPKTFNSKVSIAQQSGIALQLAGLTDEIWWSNGAFLSTSSIGSTCLATPNPIRSDSASGFCIGGINAQFGSTGLAALGQSYAADLYQGQSTYGISITSQKGASAGVVVKVGSRQGSVHANAELLRVGYGLADGISGSDGTPLMQIMGDGRAVFGGDGFFGTNLWTTVLRGGSGANSINLHGVAGIYILAGDSGLVTVDPQLFCRSTTPSKAPIILEPGAQPTGPNVIGAMYMTAAGVLKVCTTAGSPGVWVSVGAQV